MPLYKYSELNDEQKKLVSVMYTDFEEDTADQYLYNFDGDKYSGRQYAPPSGKTKDGIPFGTIHAESVESSKIPDPEGYPMGTVLDTKTGKPDIEIEDKKPVKKVVKTKKK